MNLFFSFSQIFWIKLYFLNINKRNRFKKHSKINSYQNKNTNYL